MIIGFFSLWIILCGNMTGEILVIGAVATAVVFWFTCRYCRWSLRREKLFLRLLLPGLAYGQQHASLPCSSLSPGVCPNSWPLS